MFLTFIVYLLVISCSVWFWLLLINNIIINNVIGPKARKGDGYSSEPEKGYDSDFGENRLFQNLDGEYTRNVSMRKS